MAMPLTEPVSQRLLSWLANTILRREDDKPFLYSRSRADDANLVLEHHEAVPGVASVDVRISFPTHIKVPQAAKTV